MWGVLGCWFGTRRLGWWWWWWCGVVVVGGGGGGMVGSGVVDGVVVFG